MVWRRAERAAEADEGAGAVRGVHLVSRQRDEVQMSGVVMGPHVDRAVRGELGRIDEDAAPGGVDLLSQQMHGLHHSRDIRCAGEGEEGDAAGVLGQPTIEVIDIERAVRTDAHVDRADPCSPRQVVRVVFEHGRQDH